MAEHMMVNCSMCANEHSNYLVGGNLVNAFVVGNVGSADDFFLVAAEPDPGTEYPMLTGNVLDSEGNVLFRLVRNVLVVNPRNCGKIIGDHIGYEIHDGNGVPILTVRTTFGMMTNGHEGYTTVVNGTFFNRSREQVVTASDNGLTFGDVKFGVGFNGRGFAQAHLLTGDDHHAAVAGLSTRGAVHRILRGRHENEVIDLDGKLLIDAVLIRCEIRVSKGDFLSEGSLEIGYCQFRFDGPAQQVAQLAHVLMNQADGPPEAR